MEALKPCPFCGSNEVEIDSAGHPFEGRVDIWVACEGCGTSSQIVDAVEKARSLWNTRASTMPGELVERIKAEGSKPMGLAEHAMSVRFVDLLRDILAWHEGKG